MSIKLFNLRNRLIQTVSQQKDTILAKQKNATDFLESKFVLPDRFKGTIVEKWARFWKQLGLDYKDVAISIGSTMKEKPIRSTIYGMFGGILYFCAKANPNEAEFWKCFREYNQEMVLVPETLQRKESADWLKFIQKCENESLLRYFSFGLISIIWLDNHSDGLNLYAATCDYLQPEYLKYHQRIVDVGFLNVWWNLKDKMREYDVNY